MKIKVRTVVLAVMGLLFVQSASAFYNPSTGRWLSRDPIEELAVSSAMGESIGDLHKRLVLVSHLLLNPCAFVENNPVNRMDIIGLASCDDKILKLQQSSKFKKMIERITKAGCPRPTIQGSDCCNNGFQGYHDCNTSQQKATITICCKNSANLSMTLKHELYHGLDCCKKKFNDCDDKFCSEVVASYYVDFAYQDNNERIRSAFDAAKQQLRASNWCMERGYEVTLEDARMCIESYKKRNDDDKY